MLECCVISVFLHNNTTHNNKSTHLLSQSFCGWGSGHGPPGSSAACCIKVSGRTGFSWEEKKNALPQPCGLEKGFRSLQSLELWVLCSCSPKLEAMPSSLSCGPLQHHHTTSSKPGREESPSKTSIRLCVSFCCNILVGSASHPNHTEGEGITQGHDFPGDLWNASHSPFCGIWKPPFLEIFESHWRVLSSKAPSHSGITMVTTQKEWRTDWWERKLDLRNSFRMIMFVFLKKWWGPQPREH